MIEAATDRDDPNHETRQALIDYCSFSHEQGFAIMLNGRWGSGKTRFIKDLAPQLARARPGETVSKALYVSLYGVSVTAEIDSLLFEQMHPILGGKAARLAWTYIRGAAKLSIPIDLGGGSQLGTTLQAPEITSILQGAGGRVVIFDDFERALLKPTSILGYINPLIEHEDTKVIIVADEEQLKGDDKTDFEERKEKTIGQTFEFTPNVEIAYNSFLGNVDDAGARECLTRFKTLLLQVFADSQTNNLRLLKQLLWDFERMWLALTPEQQAHEACTQELLSVLCAAALELRSGRMKENQFTLDYSGFAGIFMKKEVGKETNHPMEAALKRYPTVSFDSALLDAPTICDCVLRSRVSKRRVQERLKQHPYFVRPEESASWRTLWWSFEALPDVQEEIVSRFEEDFDHRRFETEGAILHVIGLGLWLGELGFINWSDDEVEPKLKKYIDDVFARRDPTVEEAVTGDMEDFSDGTDGLGYKHAKDPRFAALSHYERQARSVWKRRGYPEIASRLTDLAKTDSEQFLREVCFTQGGFARFARIGVLKLISAKDFAGIIASLPYASQNKIAMALSIRYDHSGPYPELQRELPWLLEVRSEVTEAASNLPRIAKGALLNLLRRYVDTAITLLESQARSSAPIV